MPDKKPAQIQESIDLLEESKAEKKKSSQRDVRPRTPTQQPRKRFSDDLCICADKLMHSTDIPCGKKTHDVMYRKLNQFKQMDGSKDPDDVPEIFFLLVNFFDQNPSVYQYEGIFHVSCSDERLYELEVHLGMKNYYILNEMVESP
jgi:hypothetical protein